MSEVHLWIPTNFAAYVFEIAVELLKKVFSAVEIEGVLIFCVSNFPLLNSLVGIRTHQEVHNDFVVSETFLVTLTYGIVEFHVGENTAVNKIVGADLLG